MLTTYHRYRYLTTLILGLFYHQTLLKCETTPYRRSQVAWTALGTTARLLVYASRKEGR